MKGIPILFALILLLGGSFSLPSLSHASNPSTTPTIDGSSLQGCSHFTNSCSTLFSTTRSNDIVIVYAFETLDLQTSCSFSVKDTAGLSWEMRAAVSGRNDGTTGSDRDQIAEFWARSASPLSSDNVTESILGCASYEYGGEYNGLMVYGISGANFQNPFDPSGSVPASVSGLNGTPAALISTSNPNDMILGVALQSTYGVLSPGSGFTLISTGGGYSVSEYTTVNSPVTNFPVTFGDGANWYWEVIADAVQAANTAPDFGLSASPSSLTVTAGSSGTSTVNVTSINSFNGTVKLTTSPAPLCVSCPSWGISPSSVDLPPGGTASSILTFYTTTGTPPTTWVVTVTGTSGSISHSVNVAFTVVSSSPAPDFTMSAHPNMLTIPQGSAGKSIILLTSVNGFQGNVTLSPPVSCLAIGCPQYTISPTVVQLAANQNATAGFTIYTSPQTPLATYNVAVTGTSGSLSHSAPVTFTVVASGSPDFTISANPSSQTVVAGSTGKSQIVLTSINNFNGTVNLQATVTPAGPGLSLDPSSVSVPSGGSGSSVLTVSTTNDTASAIYQVTIAGTSGSSSHTTTVAVNVVAPTTGSLGIDGSAEGGCGHDTNSCSVTLSTLHGSDLVIVYAMESLDLQTSCNFSVSDTAGLYWTLRGSVSGRNDGTTVSDRDQIAEFWAVSPSVLSSDIITESISGCASLEYGGEYNSLLVVAVAGANLSSPFDPNVSLPGSASGYSNTPTPTLSTGNSQDLIISAGQQSSFGTLTPGAGFTQIFSSGPGGSAEEYQIVNSPQTSLTVTYVDDTTWYWEIMSDAVQAAPPDPQVQQTATFDGVTVSLSGNFIINATSRAVTGTISVTATNSTTGQTLFSKTFTVSIGYGSRSTARFVLSVPAGSSWLGATCSINASTDTAGCIVSRDPDVNHDGTIGLQDVAQVFFAYGSSKGDARYNPSLDLYGYGTINLFDASLAAIDYGLPVFS